MGVFEAVHERWGIDRRARVLARQLATRLPSGGRILDVGTGSGTLARLVQLSRRELHIVGVDVWLARRPLLPTALFDGWRLPFPDGSFDAAMLVDVLHHADNARALLGEVVRVSPSVILIKDHLREGLGAQLTLAFMDRVGNARFGVASPGHYLDRGEWMELFRLAGLRVNFWSEDLRIYPKPLDWLFGRSLHFLAQLSAS